MVGHDTASHELAHVLDAADGNFDGTPVLRGVRAKQPDLYGLLSAYYHAEPAAAGEGKGE